MSTPMDNAQALTKTENHSYLSMLGKTASEVADFGEGLYHGAIESPINGAVQLSNHVIGTKLPELHLVDEERLSHSGGGILGNIAGTALDVYALTAATAGVGGALGGSALLSSALRLGAVGAAYTAALQPTDAKSEHFIQDRLTNGAIALGTFATMGGAGALLDSTGLVAVSAARSLSSNLAYGAITGAAGGIAHAESSAILKDGQILPSL
ncbi:MAG: hypothetical protein KGS72_28020, partial [Cyanobacteria bacterium REEB67]|nr:hypothetical protein [Cyanobacteria bacterium REEB67]